MKLLLLLCLVTTYFTYSADESDFLIRFKDKPGIYRIKIEMIKNLKINHDKPDTYEKLFHCIDDYTQENEWESFVEPYLTIPQDAQYLRISVRSGLGFKKGWRFYLPIAELRKKMRSIKSDKIICPGIRIENQFEEVLKNEKLKYTVESDSFLIQ